MNFKFNDSQKHIYETSTAPKKSIYILRGIFGHVLAILAIFAHFLKKTSSLEVCTIMDGMILLYFFLLFLLFSPPLADFLLP